jgi:hypothetical protein
LEEVEGVHEVRHSTILSTFLRHDDPRAATASCRPIAKEPQGDDVAVAAVRTNASGGEIAVAYTSACNLIEETVKLQRR